MAMIIFETIDRFGRKIRLTKQRLLHITERDEMIAQEEKFQETLTNPDQIRKSVKDETILIFYKFYPITPITEKYLAVIVKTLNDEGFIVSSYFTDRIKEGEQIWKKD